jgi:hypothetical protein
MLANAGAIVVDRFVSDDELASLYSCADFMWSCYSPTYNQASGIFGRAVQYGVPSIVRKGSYIHKQANIMDLSVVPLEWNDVESAVATLGSGPAPRREMRSSEIEEMRNRSLDVLSAGLGWL